MISKNLIKKFFLNFQKFPFIYLGIIFVLIESPIANDAKIQLKEIEEKIKQNKMKQNELKTKQNIINKNIEKIENTLKKSEYKLKNILSENVKSVTNNNISLSFSKFGRSLSDELEMHNLKLMSKTKRHDIDRKVVLYASIKND